MNTLPISAILPTQNRPVSLGLMFESLLVQSILPAELIVIDGSMDSGSKQVVEQYKSLCSPDCVITWQAALQLGAATQRNQGLAMSTQPFIWFFEDDIVFEAECAERLWRAITGDESLGGVSAMIANQHYGSPGWISRTFFAVLAGRRAQSFAGRVIGPAMNLLPEDCDDLPEVVKVDWLNLGCTIYRREALPMPPFDSHFTGYSFMEDVALSLTVGRNWKLANARTARIYHDSQPAEYKSSQFALARMEMINRHYVMTRILGRRSAIDYAKLTLLEIFGIVTSLVSARAWKSLPAVLLGKASGIAAMLRRESGSDPKEVVTENSGDFRSGSIASGR